MRRFTGINEKCVSTFDSLEVTSLAETLCLFRLVFTGHIPDHVTQYLAGLINRTNNFEVV